MKRSRSKSRRRSRSRSKSRKQKSPSSNIIILKKSTNPDKKFMAIIGNKTVHFGAKGYSDYTQHKDPERMKRYENRHRKRENWTKSGIKSAGFWSKWILWNKPSLTGSIKDTERRFNIKIRRSNS
jgi:hypothetical protein